MQATHDQTTQDAQTTQSTQPTQPTYATQAVSTRPLGQADDWTWMQLNAEADVSALSMSPDDANERYWTRASAFPSEIHVELLRAGVIPDPRVGFNEHKVQWVGDAEWLYRCAFTIDTNVKHKHGFLTFEGLDTVCDVYLNGAQILSTDNMFRTYTYVLDPVTHQSKGQNTLMLHFKSAKALAKSEEARYGRVRAGSTNLGDPSRVYVRKAQYDWRWDWGPELMTCGPYRPITLTTYDLRIAQMTTRAEITNNLSLTLSLVLEGSLSDNTQYDIQVTMSDAASGHVIYKDTQRTETTTGSMHATIALAMSWRDLERHGAQRWWPVGYGAQNLYDVDAVLMSEDGRHTIDTASKRIGFRSVVLVQEPLPEPDQHGTGTSFLFEINGVRMFMGGSNWIPADNFLTTVSAQRYRDWLTLLRDGNQNMVRLWGGGVYEPDVFYEICDELGILVWQDFQFACGVYPAHGAFLESVQKEAEDNVRRLAHHPSIVCFCGNNEDYQMVLQWGGINDLPARKIYEEILPAVILQETGDQIPYHRGSPYGGKGWDTTDPTIGDVHQWNVWGGKEYQYQEYDRLGGRFVSEFGMPGMPSMDTIKYWSQGVDPSQMYAQSPLMAQHTKAGVFERRFAIVMNENFRLTSDLETHVYNTQLMQSEAVSFAYRSWRREWRGKNREYCAGVLVWQLNDCWPGVSWAIADYFVRPKPVYYTIARELAPITVGIFRKVIKNRDNDRPRQFYEFGATQVNHTELDIWATNSTLESRTVELEITFFDLLDASWSEKETHNIALASNQTTELLKGITCRAKSPPEGTQPGDPSFITAATVVVSARLLDPKSRGVIARCSNWPEPYRYLSAPDPGLVIRARTNSGGTEGTTVLSVSVRRPAKCVFFSVEGADSGVRWSDNAIDLIPGDEQLITVRGIGRKEVRMAYFGHEQVTALGADGSIDFASTVSDHESDAV